MKFSVFEFDLFLNKYAIFLKERKKNNIIQLINQRGHGKLNVPWARKLDSRGLSINDAPLYFFFYRNRNPEAP